MDVVKENDRLKDELQSAKLQCEKVGYQRMVTGLNRRFEQATEEHHRSNSRSRSFLRLNSSINNSTSEKFQTKEQFQTREQPEPELEPVISPMHGQTEKNKVKSFIEIDRTKVNPEPADDNSEEGGKMPIEAPNDSYKNLRDKYNEALLRNFH